MRTFVSASMLLAFVLLAGCAHQTKTSAAFVSITSSDGVSIASVKPASIPYTQGGPTATAWLAGKGAHLADGRIVSGIMIRSWSESGAARVQVYGLTTRPGAEATFTTDETQLEPVELGSYLLQPNQRVAVAEMASLGAEPLLLRY